MVKRLSFKRAALLQCMLVVIAYAITWFYLTYRHIHSPIGSHEEYYTHRWDFQFYSGVLYFIGVAVITALVLAVEHVLVSAVQKLTS